MNRENLSDSDEALRRVLREWRTDGDVLSPRFEESVWRRIARAQDAAPPSVSGLLAHWIGAVLPRPALTATYLILLFTLGATLGWAQARQETGRVKSALGERYVRVLDPYLALRQ